MQAILLLSLFIGYYGDHNYLPLTTDTRTSILCIIRSPIKGAIMRHFITFASLIYCSLTYAQITKIIVWDSVYNNPTSIMMDYLHRALQVTEAEYGSYELVKSAEMEQGRSLLEIAKQKNSKLDVASYATTSEREKLAIPIRIPMLSSLMGYRLCLIKENRQALFDGIKNNILNRKFLKEIKKKDGKKIVYADKCLIDEDVLEKHQIIFKQIPYQIKVY